MVTMQTVLEQLDGKDTVETLVRVMAEKFSDFGEAQNRYLRAMDTLREELGDAATPSVAEEMEAIQRQTASNLLFSGLLGLRANLDHFIDPVARNFLEVDPETYLREEIARSLPEYESARQVRDRFYASLSPTQKEVYGDTVTYVSHLETVGPKLAHYYGYMLGNVLLRRVVPGYHADAILTAQYTAMLEEYLGKQLDAL